MIINLYVHTDESSSTTQAWKSFFKNYLPTWELRLCDATKILEENPTHVLFPGGSGSAFFKKLGKKQSAKIKKWVKEGGSYIGVCAGAYLASNHLKITSLNIPDKAWERGLHDVEIILDGKSQIVNYHNGPIFEVTKKVEILSTFKSNVLAENGFYAMEGTPAITRNLYGKGTVSLFSPHLEKSPDKIKKELVKLFEYIDYKLKNP